MVFSAGAPPCWLRGYLAAWARRCVSPALPFSSAFPFPLLYLIPLSSVFFLPLFDKHSLFPYFLCLFITHFPLSSLSPLSSIFFSLSFYCFLTFLFHLRVHFLFFLSILSSSHSSVYSLSLLSASSLPPLSSSFSFIVSPIPSGSSLFSASFFPCFFLPFLSPHFLTLFFFPST